MDVVCVRLRHVRIIRLRWRGAKGCRAGPRIQNRGMTTQTVRDEPANL
jgi:hypothetical protein